MDDERFDQVENAEQTEEEKPEIVWDETGQGIYKETTHRNRGEYHQTAGMQNEKWQENSAQMGQQTYQPVSKGFGIASLVLGILSLILYCTCINILLAVLAIIFGIIQLVQKDSPKGMAIAGIITSCLSIVFFVISLIVFMSSTEMQEAFEQGFQNGIQGDFNFNIPFEDSDDFYNDYDDYDDYDYHDYYDYDEDGHGSSDTF